MPIAVLDERDKEELQEQINGKVGKDEFEDLSNPNRHAEYFNITDDGVLSLKPEYRGASTGTNEYGWSDNGKGKVGSQNAELPKHLVMPEAVRGTAVDTIAPEIFRQNEGIKVVEFPKTIKHIPDYCFQRTYLEKLLNVEQITTIGGRAFYGTYIKSISLPNLITLGDMSFAYCADLTHINVGKITTIPMTAFLHCEALSRVDYEGAITSIGLLSFFSTPKLRNTDFVKGVTSIGEGAFISSGYDYDWDLLTNCNFGTNATSKQINPTDFWSECVVTECENPLPTVLSQFYGGWTNKSIGTSGKKWGSGCQLFAIMHAYCGLHNIKCTSVEEFEAIISEKGGANFINTFSNKADDIEPFAEGLGLTATEYAGYNKANLQALYDALAAGKYAVLTVSGGTSGAMSGHAVLAYGVTKDGRFKIADSNFHHMLEQTTSPIGLTYEVPYKSLCAPSVPSAQNGITHTILGKA